MISTSTMSLRTGIVPRWMAYLGLALALFLLLSLGFFEWAPLVFPLWVLLISVHILLANLGKPKAQITRARDKPFVVGLGSEAAQTNNKRLQFLVFKRGCLYNWTCTTAQYYATFVFSIH